MEELQRWLATQVRLKKFEEKEREKIEERMEELAVSGGGIYGGGGGA